MAETVAGPSFAELGLQVRAAVLRALSPAARLWLEAPPLDMPGRPPRLPGTLPDESPFVAGNGPREWRIYSRRGQDSRAPFLLRAVLPDAKPYERLVEGAFRTLLNRAPDPAGRDAYARALASGALDAGVLLRDIAGSPEGRTGEEQTRLICALVP